MLMEVDISLLNGDESLFLWAFRRNKISLKMENKVLKLKKKNIKKSKKLH